VTSLSATDTSYREQYSLIDFLATTNLKSLVEIEVTVKTQNGFRKNLFDAIRQRSRCLKKLNLQASMFADEDENKVKVDWTFFGEMGWPKDYQLVGTLMEMEYFFWNRFREINLSVCAYEESAPRNVGF